MAIDALASWVPLDRRQAAWDRISAVPEPVGFDPAIIWPEGSSADDCAFLELTAHRVIARPARSAGLRWVGPTDRT